MNKLDFEQNTNEQPDFELFYNTHFIEINEQCCIIKGWSDAFAPATENSIIINEQGSYQFRFWSDGEENPNLFTMDGIPLYKWDSEQVIARSEEEIEADRAAMPKPVIPPTDHERLEALENGLAEMMMTLMEE